MGIFKRVETDQAIEEPTEIMHINQDSENSFQTMRIQLLSSSPRLIEDETFNDSDIINNMMDYEDGQEEPDSL
ncbi:hypothetical protein TNCV_215941 [Trichonephila clavipes]|nr:hypothetical protein TNCV_215941 [Trichonephila clavipes]